MNAGIEEFISSFTDAFRAKLYQERQRADDALKQNNQIRIGLKALLDGLDDGEPTPAPATESIEADIVAPDIKATNPPKPSRKRIADTVFFEALTTEWQTAAAIHAKLGREDISRATVFNRLPKLVGELIEQRDKPTKAWRVRGRDEHEPEAPSATLPVIVPATVPAIIPPPLPATAAKGVSLHHADCFDVLSQIPDGSVHLVVADLPYGITDHDYDQPIDVKRLWHELERVLTPTGTALMFSVGKLEYRLFNAAEHLWRYKIVWKKNKPTGHVHCNNRPMLVHEDIIVFSKGVAQHENRSGRRMTYNPQGIIHIGEKQVPESQSKFNYHGNVKEHRTSRPHDCARNYPRSIWTCAKDTDGFHSFQKPVALLEELIRTYSNDGEVVLDPTMGSGSTVLAAIKAGRKVIGIEQDTKFFDVAQQRIKSVSG